MPRLAKNMTSRQCEIAAESYSASLLAQSGYDVLVQYGAHQPDYDLAAVKGPRKLLLSIKGSQAGGWALAVSFKKSGRSYHQAIDAWCQDQRDDVIFLLVEFLGVSFGDAPRVYISRPTQIAAHMKTQCNGNGHASLAEDWYRDHPRARRSDSIPTEWVFTKYRIDTM
jgi:hypothetical protein